MNIDPEQLESNGYQLFERLEHDQLMPFVKSYIKKSTLSSRLYFAATIAFGVAAGVLLGVGLLRNQVTLVGGIAHFVTGFGASILLLPLHEWIHAATYKLLGAHRVSYDLNLRKLYVMALADRFVVNRLELTLVALAPFCVISAVLVGVALFVPLSWSITVAATLFMHTSMCSGDFSMLSFFECHKQKQVVTYDDIATRVSYFYSKKSTNEEVN